MNLQLQLRIPNTDLPVIDLDMMLAVLSPCKKLSE